MLQPFQALVDDTYTPEELLMLTLGVFRADGIPILELCHTVFFLTS
jgi:hypothetical protein